MPEVALRQPLIGTTVVAYEQDQILMALTTPASILMQEDFCHLVFQFPFQLDRLRRRHNGTMVPLQL